MAHDDIRHKTPLIVLAGEGRTSVRLELREFGRDLILHIGGGAVHAGAVAVSHRGGLGGEPATELITTPGHKEGPLARDAAQILAAATDRTCVVVAGIHQDDATGEEIDAIVANVTRAVKELAVRLATS
jgi:gallate decarboxylase subunit D